MKPPSEAERLTDHEMSAPGDGLFSVKMKSEYDSEVRLVSIREVRGISIIETSRRVPAGWFSSEDRRYYWVRFGEGDYVRADSGTPPRMSLRIQLDNFYRMHQAGIQFRELERLE